MRSASMMPMPRFALIAEEPIRLAPKRASCDYLAVRR